MIQQQKSDNQLSRIYCLTIISCFGLLYLIIMVRNILQITIFCFCIITISSLGIYNLALMSQERGAACLDGSPAGLYYRMGQGVNKTKYLIYFNGGGFCQGTTVSQTLESCYKRSRSKDGSTKHYTKTMNLGNEGILSTLAKSNPNFHDWTKIFIIYCDGSEFTGSRKDPIKYKNVSLYFRGYNNTLEQFRYMDEKFDIYNGDSIVITGDSSGGIASFIYSNHLVQNTKKAKIYAIPDSGLFITQFYSPIVKLQPIKLYAENLFKLINDQNNGFPVKECVNEHSEDLYLCYNAAYLAKYLKAPLFIIESQYDEFAISNIVVANCLSNKQAPYSADDCNQTTRQIIQDYRLELINAMKIIKGDRRDVGVWSPSCIQHGFIQDDSLTSRHFKIPSGTGKTASEAISQFLQHPKEAIWNMDDLPWPFNVGCNGIDQSNLSFN